MNQREIAKRLQVSQTTVSLVLKDPESRKVSKETRERIIEELRKTSYRRHAVPALRKIYFVSTSGSVYQRQLFLDGVFQFAEEFGITVELKSMEMLLNRKTQGNYGLERCGCVLHGVFPEADIRQLTAALPVCHLNPPPETYLCDSIAGDSRESVKMALQRLAAQGCEQPVFWGLPHFQTNESGIYFQHKLEAFRALYPEFCAGSAAEHLILVKTGSSDYGTLLKLSRQALLEYPGAAAFIAAGYAHAKILFDAALHLERPCRIVSCGYSEYAELGIPLFDYITCDLVKMGKIAAAQLLKRAEWPDAPVCSLRCCPELFPWKPVSGA